MPGADGPLTISAERAARNDAAFRQANEEIRAYAADWEMTGGLPTICECADLGCTAVVSLTPAEYEDVRVHPARFIHVPGHEASDHGWGEVVADFGEYVVVEKVGAAARIAKQLDPRGRRLMDERERRIGENEALFRSVNEKVQELGESFSSLTDTFVIVCECGSQSCLDQIELQLAEYERVRANPLHFVIKPGHEYPEVEEVVEKTDRFWVVEKDSGTPATVARQSDPRS